VRGGTLSYDILGQTINKIKFINKDILGVEKKDKNTAIA